MAKTDRNRQERLRDFVSLPPGPFRPEPFQIKIAGALLGPEREKLINLRRKERNSAIREDSCPRGDGSASMAAGVGAW